MDLTSKSQDDLQDLPAATARFEHPDGSARARKLLLLVCDSQNWIGMLHRKRKDTSSGMLKKPCCSKKSFEMWSMLLRGALARLGLEACVIFGRGSEGRRLTLIEAAELVEATAPMTGLFCIDWQFLSLQLEMSGNLGVHVGVFCPQ